jgi:hypothetical protein
MAREHIRACVRESVACGTCVCVRRKQKAQAFAMLCSYVRMHARAGSNAQAQLLSTHLRRWPLLAAPDCSARSCFLARSSTRLQHVHPRLIAARHRRQLRLYPVKCCTCSWKERKCTCAFQQKTVYRCRARAVREPRQ